MMEQWADWLEWAVFLAGLGQLALGIGSLSIPKVLRWREETAKLRPLTRQIFWTYAGYILVTNLSFGLLSALGPHLLIAGTPLAAAVTAYMAAYWDARLILQLTVLDRSEAPREPLLRAAAWGLELLFIYLSLVYTGAAVFNILSLWR